jgi:short-subunit dehydrogenase
MKNILIIGATSAIARKFSDEITSKDARLFLIAKEADQLDEIKRDMEIRKNVQVDTFQLDIMETSKIVEAISTAKSALGSVDIALIAHGTLPDQQLCNNNLEETFTHFEINATGTILLCQQLANIFEKQKHGTLVVMASVAGDRGRQSNYLYGAAKGSIIIFLQGLRNRLTNFGVKVITIKPGFVDTPMTAHLPKNPLFSSPDKIAKGIVTAIKRNKNNEIYLPGYWRLIMFIIKLIPNKIFNRLSL